LRISDDPGDSLRGRYREINCRWDDRIDEGRDPPQAREARQIGNHDGIEPGL